MSIADAYNHLRKIHAFVLGGLGHKDHVPLGQLLTSHKRAHVGRVDKPRSTARR